MIVDDSIVYGLPMSVTSAVTYYLYHDDSSKVTIPASPERLASPVHRACFIDLIKQLDENPKLNRIAYLPRLLYGKFLSREIAKKWIKIATKTNFLPKYVLPIHFDSTFVLDLTEIKNNPNLLYIYLANLRFIEEEPHFVRSVVHLIRHYKIDPFAAIAFTAALTINHSGHGYLMYRDLYSKVQINSLRVPINWAIGLYRFITKPDRFKSSRRVYSCTATIRDISKISVSLTLARYTDPNVINAIHTDDDETAAKYLHKAGINSVF
jgi:hypothetical protein